MNQYIHHWRRDCGVLQRIAVLAITVSAFMLAAACGSNRALEIAATQEIRQSSSGVSAGMPLSASSTNASSTRATAAASSQESIVQLLTPGMVPDFLKSSKARDYFVRGSTLQMQERPAEAILEFQQALRYDTSAVIYYVIAQNYFKLNKPELAQEAALHAIKLDSTYLPPYKLMGEMYIAQYRLDDAILLYHYIVAREPDVQNRFTLARLYEYRNVDKAIEVYSELLNDINKDDPNEQIVLGRLVELQAKQGKTEQAIRVLQALYKKYPDNTSYINALVEAYIVAKKLTQADSLLAAVESRMQDSESIRLSLMLGESIIQQLDSMAEAKPLAFMMLERAERRMKSSFSTSSLYQMLCGMLSLCVDNLPQSRYYFDRAVALADSAIIPLQISLFYFQRQHLLDMANFASQSARKFSHEPRLAYMAGFAFSQVDSTKRAIEELKRAVNIDERYIDAWSQLGILYNSIGQFSLSDSAYERVLALDPDNALVNNNYAYSFSERNIELDRAERMTQRALKAEPNNPSYLDTMGWIYYQQGKYEKALEYIGRAVAQGETSATIYEHLGDVYYKLGNIPKALEAWKEALRKEPQRSSTKERLSRLGAK
jgi:tetratricopeptide (TPR) repeat protein